MPPARATASAYSRKYPSKGASAKAGGTGIALPVSWCPVIPMSGRVVMRPPGMP